MHKSTVKIFWGLLACWLLSACEFKKPDYPKQDGSLRMYPTISSDGKLLVVLDRIGQETPRLRIKWLDRDDPGLEIPAPKYTSNVRFGLTGYDLLITHARPGPEGASQLSRWDASQPSKSSEILFEGNRVAFPVEVKPGQVLIRMCPQPPAQQACANGHDLVWALVEDGKATPIKETLGLYPLGTPNVTEDGFFWTVDKSLSARTGQNVIAYGFPNKKPPKFDALVLDETTGVSKCDQKANRCLVNYLTNERINGSTYVYSFKVLNDHISCNLEDIKGWQDDFSVTPDGQAAVISSSRVFEEPRHVVVMRFTPGQCEPTSIQHIQFKETSK